MANAANPRLPVVVLISGRGSNLQSIMDAVERGSLPIDIRAVISNRPDAGGLQRAALSGIRTLVIDHTGYSSREAFDRALMTSIDSFEPKWPRGALISTLPGLMSGSRFSSSRLSARSCRSSASS